MCCSTGQFLLALRVFSLPELSGEDLYVRLAVTIIANFLCFSIARDLWGDTSLLLYIETVLVSTLSRVLLRFKRTVNGLVLRSSVVRAYIRNKGAKDVYGVTTIEGQVSVGSTNNVLASTWFSTGLIDDGVWIEASVVRRN